MNHVSKRLFANEIKLADTKEQVPCRARLPVHVHPDKGYCPNLVAPA